MTLSSRVPRGAAPNPLTRALARLRADGVAVADLTESNPTRVELPYPRISWRRSGSRRACATSRTRSGCRRRVPRWPPTSCGAAPPSTPIAWC